MSRAATFKTARQVQASAAQICKALETLRGIRDARTGGKVSLSDFDARELELLGLASAQDLDSFLSYASGLQTLYLRAFAAKGVV